MILIPPSISLPFSLFHFRSFVFSCVGGTLRIFGESLNKDVPYKTLLLSTKDTAAHVVREILEKYGTDKEAAPQYCLVQLIVPHNIGDINNIHDLNGDSGLREYILDDDDCPLAIEKQHLRSRGALSFHIKRRPQDYQPRKRKKKPEHQQMLNEYTPSEIDSASSKLEDTPSFKSEDAQSSRFDDAQSSKFDDAQSSKFDDAPSAKFEDASSAKFEEASNAKFEEAMQGSKVDDSPEIQVIMLRKSNNGMGLSIVATKGLNQDKLGIYIKTVVKGGAADIVSFFNHLFTVGR